MRYNREFGKRMGECGSRGVVRVSETILQPTFYDFYDIKSNVTNCTNYHCEDLLKFKLITKSHELITYSISSG